MTMNGIECAFFGRVANAAELKTSQAGKPWLAIKVAVGNDDAVQWLRVVSFGDTAVSLANTIEKGGKVYVEGTIRLDRWKNAEGEDRSGLSVAAWKVEKVGASAIGRNKPAKPKAPPEGEHSAPPSTRDWQKPLGDDAIPFAPEWR